MRKFWVIASDVYKKNVKSISFFIMLLIPFIFGGIFYVAGSYISKSNEVETIGLVNQTGIELPSNVEGLPYQLKPVDSVDTGAKQLHEKTLDALLVLTEEKGTIHAQLSSENSLGLGIETAIQQLATSLQTSIRSEKLGLNPADVASLNQAAIFSKKKVRFDDNETMVTGDDQGGAHSVIGIIGTVVLFFFILTYVGIIAQEIASEKGTRIMEVILSSTRAKTHFYGKLAGVLFVALTQFVCYSVALLISYQWTKDMPFVKAMVGSISIGSLFGNYLLFTLLFTILGIFIYSVLAAVCGSLVNKAEDTAKVILPVTYLAIIGYMLGIVLGNASPNNLVIKVTSYIPFLSSFIMPIRLANESVTLVGASASIGILLITVLILTHYCAKMYRSNVLIYNDNGLYATLKQSWRLMKTEK